VFLLSVNEVAKYFKDDNSRVVRLDGHMRWWWLRSTGYYDDYAANVNSPGLIDATGSLSRRAAVAFALQCGSI
jgi:hypothetical protein